MLTVNDLIDSAVSVSIHLNLDLSHLFLLWGVLR